MRYEGEYVNDEADGIGMLINTDPSGKKTYVGEWKNTAITGFGKYVDEMKGVIYIGEFRDGLKHGHGYLEKKNDSTTYVGNFLEGKTTCLS